MRTFVFHLFLFIAIVFQASAQSKPPGPDGISPNNKWPNAGYIKTDEEFTIQACRWIVQPNGPNIPIPGNSVALTTYTTQYSGYHSHEISLQGRPQAIIETIYITSTDTNGCASWTVAIPGLAGWYTFEATFNATCYANQCFNSTVKGENLYARELALDDSGQFVAYPDNPSINVSQSTLVDPNHGSSVFGYGLSRYMTRTSIPGLEAASEQYQTDALNKAGYVDEANVFRISLPDGGDADNQSYTYGAADWETQAFEEHARGNEVDIITPGGGANQTLANILVSAFAANRCRLGIFQPNTLNRLPNRNSYWTSQGYMHFACASSPLTQRAPGRPF